MTVKNEKENPKAKVVRALLKQPELRDALRSRYQTAGMDERFLALLVRLRQAEPETVVSNKLLGGTRDLPFPHVTVSMGATGKTGNICSVAEAAEWLVLYWPIAKGEKLSGARQACFDALDGKITCTKARNAFIDAAREAGIYITQQKL